MKNFTNCGCGASQRCAARSPAHVAYSGRWSSERRVKDNRRGCDDTPEFFGVRVHLIVAGCVMGVQMCRIKWIQHAVGHGGFHTAQVFTGWDAQSVGAGPSFTWVFDCGSRRTSKFDDYLRVWTRLNPQPIDWLFISHFDLDHVSGLDVLMSRNVVRDVMVPYVNERELAYSFLEEIRRDRHSPSF